MGTAATFLTAITNTLLKQSPMTLFSGVLVAQSAPTDAVPPPSTWGTIGNGVTADVNGNWTPVVGAIRCDGFRQISVSLGLFGSSGAVTATFRPYFFDGIRWCQCADVITITNSLTSEQVICRQRHDIYVENDFGFLMVLESITGTGATAECFATLKDAVIGLR